MDLIQPLNKTNLPSIKVLLESYELPDSDIETSHALFFGIKKKNQLLVTGAIEIYDSDAILRSVAVHRDFQKIGYGKIMVKFLEKKAIQLGIKKLYLLTTTAENFFRKCNYNSISRELCPESIKTSTQFAEICPSNASCMCKKLLG